MDIEKNIQQFTEGRGKNRGWLPDERYASFDYCFNYFQSFREKGRTADLSSAQHIQMSCLQLAFYLASWGMFRGSAHLREKSSKFYEGVIQLISEYDNRIWSIDVDDYSEENVEILIDFKARVVDALGKSFKPSDTLVTKIMLGVFANTPAFDANFRKGFRIHSFSKNSLKLISDFYFKNRATIDNYEIHTLDFATGKETARKYTKAKIIDMIGFIEGQNKKR